MHSILRKTLLGALLALMGACSDRQGPVPNGAAAASTNAAVFDPAGEQLPLPNLLVTAQAADPLEGRDADAPMDPLEALAYINLHEMGGTQAVAGVNAPIYLRFTYPLRAGSVSADTIRVFQLTPDAAGTENAPLGFTDITGMFTFRYTAGDLDLWLFPAFPLAPGQRYLYVVTGGVLDADTGLPVISSGPFQFLKSTVPLTGAAAALEPIRADVMAGTDIALSGYAKVMDDLIAASATTGIASRDDIAVLGRFITSGAGFIQPDPAGAPATRIPVETALRSFAAGAALGGLPGKTWDNTITVTATFTKGSADPTLEVGAYWQTVTGLEAATVPSSLGQVVLGTVNSAQLGMDPVVVAANATSMDLSAALDTFDPFAGVVQPFRDPQGVLTGYYHLPAAVPFVYLAPDADAPGGGYPLVLFQHGITREKETVMALAQTLTGNGFAVLAADLPLHGALARTSLQIQPGDDAAVIAQKQAGWGSDFMALGTPLATRSNIQQAAFDLHRLELTVETGGFASLGAKAPSPGQPHFVGISLGSIVGAYYLAGNTSLAETVPPYTQATLDGDMKGLLSAPGARLAYLIQASPAFGPAVDAALAQEGLPRGSFDYNAFFQTTQTVVDSVDPASMTTPLAPGLPSRLSGRLLIQEATSTAFAPDGTPTNGDLVITNPFTRYFGSALGGRAVLGTPAAAAVAPAFFQLGYGEADRIPDAFLFTLDGAAFVPKIQSAALSASATTPREGYFQFDQEGIDHGGLLDPDHPENAALMQEQMLLFLGAGIAVDPTALAAAPAVATGVDASRIRPIPVPSPGH